jgi:hypothetical protein
VEENFVVLSRKKEYQMNHISYVNYVGNNLSPEEMEEGKMSQNAAQDLVELNCVGVKSVRKVPNEDVYCLVTERNGNFVANGIVAKNCDSLRYALYTHFFGKEMSRMTAQDIDRLYAEVIGGNTLPAPFMDIQAGYRY